MAKDDLTQKQKLFCQYYIVDWNGTQSYLKAYPDCKNENTAGVSSYDLLRNPKIDDYIKEIQKDIEKNAGISRLKVVLEHKKIAFSSIAHLHNTWIERTEFEKLTDEQKDCIESIDTKIQKVRIAGIDQPVEVEHIKIKLYDKQKALDSISKMLGYNEPEKHDLTSDGDKITFNFGGIGLETEDFEETKE